MWLIACVINKLWICGSICRDNLNFVEIHITICAGMVEIHITIRPGKVEIHITIRPGKVEIHITIRPGMVEIHITIYPGKVTKVVSPLNNVTKDRLLPRRRFILKHTTTKIDLSLV